MRPAEGAHKGAGGDSAGLHPLRDPEVCPGSILRASSPGPRASGPGLGAPEGVDQVGAVGGSCVDGRAEGGASSIRRRYSQIARTCRSFTPWTGMGIR